MPREYTLTVVKLKIICTTVDNSVSNLVDSLYKQHATFSYLYQQAGSGRATPWSGSVTFWEKKAKGALSTPVSKELE